MEPTEVVGCGKVGMEAQSGRLVNILNRIRYLRTSSADELSTDDRPTMGSDLLSGAGA